jgi:uncharacterized membrane protein
VKNIFAILCMLGLAMACNDNTLPPLINLIGLVLLVVASRKLKETLTQKEKSTASLLAEKGCAHAFFPATYRQVTLMQRALAR